MVNKHNDSKVDPISEPTMSEMNDIGPGPSETVPPFPIDEPLPQPKSPDIGGERYPDRNNTSINYAHVRTNWSTYPPGGTYECVLVSKSQILSGSLTVPKQRAHNILGVSEGCIPVSHHLTKNDDSRLVMVEEAFSNRVEAKDCRIESLITIWNQTCKRGYMAKMKQYKSQPTQVFLHGLHACFEEMKVEPWCVLCFVPLGVTGHCQLFVWQTGHPHYAGFQACSVHQWSSLKNTCHDSANTHSDKNPEKINSGLDGQGNVPLPQPGTLAIETVTSESQHGQLEAVIVKSRFVSLPNEDVTVVSPASFPGKWLQTSGRNSRKPGVKDIVKAREHQHSGIIPVSFHRRHSSMDGKKGTSERKMASSSLQNKKKGGKVQSKHMDDVENMNMNSQHGLEGKRRAVTSNDSKPFRPRQPKKGSDQEFVDDKDNIPSSQTASEMLRRRMRKTRPVQSHSM